MRYFFVLLLLFTSLCAKSGDLEKVSLRFLWLDQFQFAGYYMAKEKGFYRDAGFDVEFKKFDPTLDIAESVYSGESTYGVGRDNLIKYDSTGERITLLAAIFQSMPNVLLTLKSSNINSIHDFKGKTLMQTADVLQDALVDVMLKSHGVMPTDIKSQNHSANLDDLIEKKIDIYSGYSSNEPYILKQKGIEFNSFSISDAGLDFYSDILFTSHKNAKKNPKRVEAFKRASLQGWEYAFSHIQESVEVIQKKYNTQKKSKGALVFEAQELKKLAYFKNANLGEITEKKLQRIYDIYKITSTMPQPLNANHLIFGKNKIHFTQEEEEYLRKKKYISYCTQPNTLPYSAIENSKFTGIGSGILNTITQDSGVKFKLISTNTWKESVEKAMKKECDFLPLATYSPSRAKYFNFTKSYYKEPLVMVTKKEEPYILDVQSVMGKTFTTVKGNAYVENLLNKYPNLKIKYVKDMNEGLLSIERGESFGHIAILMSSAYALQKSSKLNLKINGQFDFTVDVSFAVRNDDDVLFGIMDKLASNLTAEELQIVLNRWISVNYINSTDSWYFKEIVMTISIILLLLLVRGYYLRKQVKEQQGLREELLVLNTQLETKVYDATKDLEMAQKIAKIGSWVMDIPTGVLAWSKQTYEIFEISSASEENLYKLFQDRIHPDDLEMLEDAYKKSIKEKTLYSVKHRILMDDGTVKYVNERGKTTYDKNGSALISYGTIQDITEKVLSEMELKKKDAFMLQQSRLAQMGEMMSMVAHQWKQPLSAIASTQITMKMAIELEKYDLSDTAQREEFLHFIDERLTKIGLYTQNLSQVITNFSNFYKPQKKPEFLSVDVVILKAFNLIKDSLKSNGVEVVFELNAECHIDIYENEFMQVILNILNNAKEQLVESSVDNPHVRIKSYTEEDEIIVEIEDNGGGIPEDVIGHVFDPYYSTKTEKNGTGLGLYMCKMIISEHHKGTISAKNTLEGATFEIKIKNTQREDR